MSYLLSDYKLIKKEIALKLYVDLIFIEIASLCNHQKKINSNHINIIKKINDKIKKTKSKDKIALLKLIKKYKTNIKSLSINTAKSNYIDPRIIISYCKKYNLKIENFYTSTLRDKFKWAFYVDENFKY